MITKKKLLTVLSSFLVYDKLITYKLYEHLGLTLEDYSEDIFRIFRVPRMKDIYLSGMIMDLEYMSFIYKEDLEIDVDLSIIKDELTFVIKALATRILLFQNKNAILVGVHFEKPDSIIIDFSTNE